jgi:hypothetical protein
MRLFAAEHLSRRMFRRRNTGKRRQSVDHYAQQRHVERRPLVVRMCSTCSRARAHEQLADVDAGAWIVRTTSGPAGVWIVRTTSGPARPALGATRPPPEPAVGVEDDLDQVKR